MKRSKYWIQNVEGVRVEFRTYVKWSTLPRVVLYTGPMGNGKTTCAVRQLVEEKDSREIVANTHLSHIPFIYDSLNDFTKLVEYKDKRVLADSAYGFADTRRDAVKRDYLLVHWLQMARKLNNSVILTMSSPSTLSRYVRDTIGAVFDPEFFFNKYGTPKITLRRLYFNRKGRVSKIVIYPTVNARKYFKYFNTTELPGLQELLKEKN